MNYTIFVGGILGIEEEKAFSFFKSSFNSIERIVIPKHEKSNRIKGYALIYMKDEEQYNQMLGKKCMNLYGRTIHLKPYLKGKNLKKFKASLNNRRIHVRGIPKSWKNSDFKSAMEKIGPFEDAYIIHDSTGKKSFGFGYVLFNTEKDANRSLKEGKKIFSELKLFFERKGVKNKAKKKSKNMKGTEAGDALDYVNRSSFEIEGSKCLRRKKQNQNGYNSSNQLPRLSFDELINLHSVKPCESFYFNRVKTLNHREAEVLGHLRFNKYNLRFGKLIKYREMMRSLYAKSFLLQENLHRY